MNKTKEIILSKSEFAEEYFRISQILDELQKNTKKSINIILYLKKQYIKLFYFSKRNKRIYHCHSKHPKYPIYPDLSLIELIKELKQKGNPWELNGTIKTLR